MANDTRIIIAVFSKIFFRTILILSKTQSHILWIGLPCRSCAESSIRCCMSRCSLSAIIVPSASTWLAAKVGVDINNTPIIVRVTNQFSHKCLLFVRVLLLHGLFGYSRLIPVEQTCGLYAGAGYE